MVPHVETHVERLARYQQQARECREQAAHAADLDGRYHLAEIAACYDLLFELERVFAGAVA